MTDRLRTGAGLVVVALIGLLIAAAVPDGELLGEIAAGISAPLGIIGLATIAWALLSGPTREASRD